MIKIDIILFKDNNIHNCCYYIYICINTYDDDINHYNCIQCIMIKMGFFSNISSHPRFDLDTCMLVIMIVILYTLNRTLALSHDNNYHQSLKKWAKIIFLFKKRRTEIYRTEVTKITNHTTTASSASSPWTPQEMMSTF